MDIGYERQKTTGYYPAQNIYPKMTLPILKRTILDSYVCKEIFDKIKDRPIGINTKGQFPDVV